MNSGRTINGIHRTENRTENGTDSRGARNRRFHDHGPDEHNGHGGDTVQLRLMGSDPAWRIDERTKRIGREGIARARAALTARVESADRGDTAVHVDRAA